MPPLSEQSEHDTVLMPKPPLFLALTQQYVQPLCLQSEPDTVLMPKPALFLALTHVPPLS